LLLASEGGDDGGGGGDAEERDAEERDAEERDAEERGVFSTQIFDRTCLHFVLLEEKVFWHRGHSNDLLDLPSVGFQPQTLFVRCLHFEAFDAKVFAQWVHATDDPVEGLLLHISPRTCRSILNLLANSLKQ
jgi:hypothetical protein